MSNNLNFVPRILRRSEGSQQILDFLPQFCQRMADLGDHPDGRIAQAYACFLLLRRMPPSREKAKQWEEMTARLRQALDDKGRDARPGAAKVEPCSRKGGDDLTADTSARVLARGPQDVV